MMTGLYVFANIHPKPEHFHDAKVAIAEILEPTRREPGCRQFNLLEGDSDGRLYLYEEWQDDAALESHHAQPYTKRVFDFYRTWLAEPVEITRLHSVDSR